ncbi:uncharacterized protein N7482_009899 [Penicillium canariense]|uniref:F-box domain-containing protein n=1 Tax=Penicillium canariense TaxID=189055 RepID=A0A9W9HS75_9EURO|nr:uncharacterized protein N7482_009899 [Penicillium canariense]KAJ5153421.1 hypothetical protein N7482_009899 [Penicillium canariense]
MDRVPNEILGQICLYLQGPEHGPCRDLSSLSWVKWICYNAAAPILYRKLTLKFWDMESLLHRDRSWAPLKSLIAYLDYLEQLDFITTNEFTSDLQQAISYYHPNCRVNITWRQAVGYSVLGTETRKQLNHRETWSDYEFDINVLQLPGLHSLAVTLIDSKRLSAGREDLDEMLPFLVTAPGLKHLDLQGQIDHLGFPLARLRGKWQGLIDARPPSQISQLESIIISGSGPREDILFKLAAAGNLSNLRTAVLAKVYEPENLAKVAKLFPNLERLFIEPNPRRRRWIHLKADHDDSIAAIRAFRPLKYLCLHSLRKVENFHRIVEQHGPSLKGLIIEPSGPAHSQYPRLEVSDIVQLATCCPNLEELRLQVQRSVGSQAECELYKALGGFFNLDSLVLDLQFDARIEPARRHLDMEDPTALRTTFMNAARDEKLALGIWAMIKLNKASRLQYLRVVPFGNERFPGEESYLLYCFARSFLVTRYNFQNPASPSVEEIGTRAREIARERTESSVYSDEIDELSLPERLTLLLHDIWPQVPEPCDWRSCWTSFPFETDTT